MSEQLTAIYDGCPVGTMGYADDRITFVYDDAWRANPHAFPLSASMPLNRREHRDDTVRPWVSGLLPDDNEVLRSWGQKFHVSPRNPFRLLSYIGEECAGAIQFVRPDHAPAWLDGDAPEGIDWLDDAEFTGRIEALLEDSSRARQLGDEGHFSLAGAQAKTALYHDPKKDRWGIPKGATPTTHIIKPDRGHYTDFAANEQFCLALASALGLPAAKARTAKIGKARCLIVERYDRTRLDDGRLIRVHQEDACQASACPPERKYQNEGGPAAKDVIALIRDHSSRPQIDVLRFLDALIFNDLIGGTDAHAKNYSLLIAGSGQIRLAPLYDLISTLPYPRDIPPMKAKLAMKIGGQYLHYRIGAAEWTKAATEWKLDRDLVLGRIQSLAEKLPDAAAALAKTLPTSKVVKAIREAATKNAKRAAAI